MVSTEVRHIGRFAIEHKALMRMLRIKDGILMEVEINHDTAIPRIIFKIEHPDMPAVMEGEVVPVVMAMYNEMTCGHGLTVYDREPGPIT